MKHPSRDAAKEYLELMKLTHAAQHPSHHKREHRSGNIKINIKHINTMGLDTAGNT